MALHRIQLRRLAVENLNFRAFAAYRMRIEVVAVEGPDLDRNIFIYQRVTEDPYSTNVPMDIFCAVAGPAEIASIPPTAPILLQRYPFYRLDFVELDFSSTFHADQAWNEISTEALRLSHAMERFANLSVIDTFDTANPN